MKYVRLSDKVSLSGIVQGFWRLPDWHMSDEENAKLLRDCVERGVTSFDTAQVYGLGACEEQLGRALKVSGLKRTEFQVISKTGIAWSDPEKGGFMHYDTRYDTIVNSVKESVRKLGCGYLDLLLIHREDPCIDHHEAARALKDLKKEGVILEAGVSNFDPFKFTALNNCMGGTLVTNQIEWNPVCFEHFNSGMMDVLVEKKIHPMIWSPLAGGRIFTSDEETCVKARAKITEIAERHGTTPDTIVYAWLMHHPVGAIPICGSRNAERLDRAIAALDVKLTNMEWYEIYVASGQQRLR